MGKLKRTQDAWYIDGTAVTATAAEINASAGTGLDATELGYLNGATAGTNVASKAVIATAGGVVPTTFGLGAAGSFSARPCNLHTGGVPAVVSTDGNNSTPVITETYWSEIFVPCNMTITGVKIFNGSDVTGNRRISLADSTGAPIAAALTASTAGSGTDAYQTIAFAAPYAAIGPATYYIGAQFSSATARFNTHTIGTHGVVVKTGDTYGTFTSFTPPAAGTFVTAVSPIASLY